MRSCNEYIYDDIYIGQKEEFEVTITEEMESSFRKITGDINPLHFDDEFAVNTGKYDSHVTFGMLTASMLSTFAGVCLPGRYSLIHSVNIGFVKPVYVGDILTISGECTDKKDSLKLIETKIKITKSDGEVAAKANMKIIVLK